MSASCIRNLYDECLRECTYCSRYQPPNNDCKFCGKEKNLYRIDTYTYVCEDCLKELVIDIHGVKDKGAVFEFINHVCADEYKKFVRDWFNNPCELPDAECELCGASGSLHNTDNGIVCEDCLFKLVIDDGRIKNFDVIWEFLTEYSDEFKEFLKDWFSEARVVNV